MKTIFSHGFLPEMKMPSAADFLSLGEIFTKSNFSVKKTAVLVVSFGSMMELGQMESDSIVMELLLRRSIEIYNGKTKVQLWLN